MATDIDAFLDDTGDIAADVSSYLDRPTLTEKKRSRAEVFADVANNQGFFTNLAAGAGAAVEGWRLGLKQLLGRPPTNGEVKEYQDAVAGLRGTGGGMTGEIAANIAPGMGMFKLATAPARVAGLMTKGGVPGALANVGIGSATGALEGALVPVAEDQSRVSNIAMGAGMGAVGTALPGFFTKAGSIVKNATLPYFSKNAARLEGGKMLQTVAGEQSPEIIRALRAAQPSATGAVPTAGQAVVRGGVEAPEFMTTQAAMEKMYPSNVLSQQQAARKATLSSFAGTPAEVESMEAARKATAAANNDRLTDVSSIMRRSRESSVMPPKPVVTLVPSNLQPGMNVTHRTAGDVPIFPSAPALESLKQNPAFQATIADARRRAASLRGLPDSGLSKSEIDDIIKDPTKSFRGLQIMKAAIDDRFANPTVTTTALSKIDDRSLTKLKNAFTGASEEAVPGWSASRQQYAQQSGDILQKRVGQRLEDILSPNVGTTERRAMLAKAVNDETSLLKKSGGFNRADLDSQMTPQNMAKINAIVDDLDVDARFIEQARQGASGAKVRGEFGKSIDLPNLMNSAVALTNSATRKLTGRAKEKTLGELAVILRDPKATADIMEKATKREANAIKFLMRSMQTGAIGTTAFTEAQIQ